MVLILRGIGYKFSRSFNTKSTCHEGKGSQDVGFRVFVSHRKDRPLEDMDDLFKDVGVTPGNERR